MVFHDIISLHIILRSRLTGKASFESIDGVRVGQITQLEGLHVVMDAARLIKESISDPRMNDLFAKVVFLDLADFKKVNYAKNKS